MALAEQLGTFTTLVGGPEYVHCLLVSESRKFLSPLFHLGVRTVVLSLGTKKERI